MTTASTATETQRVSTLQYFLIAFFGSFVLSVYDVGALKGFEEALKDGIWAIIGFKVFQGICTGIIVVFVYRETNIKKAFFLGIAMQSLMLSLKANLPEMAEQEAHALAMHDSVKNTIPKVDTIAFLRDYIDDHKHEIDAAVAKHDSSADKSITAVFHPRVFEELRRNDSVKMVMQQVNIDTTEAISQTNADSSNKGGFWKILKKY